MRKNNGPVKVVGHLTQYILQFSPLSNLLCSSVLCLFINSNNVCCPGKSFFMMPEQPHHTAPQCKLADSGQCFQLV